MFLTKQNPNILIQVYCLDTGNNPSDLCSKWQHDPIRSCNSSLWRLGHPLWSHSSFPAPDDVFLEIQHGAIKWTGPSFIPAAQCTCGRTLCSTQNGPPCFCHPCTVDNMQNINQAKYHLAAIPAKSTTSHPQNIHFLSTSYLQTLFGQFQAVSLLFRVGG